YNRLRQSLPSRTLIPAACCGRKPMEPTAMAPRRNGHGGGGFACTRPDGAKPSPAWGRVAPREKDAIIFLCSLGASSAVLIAQLVTMWGGSNGRHVSSCSAQVLSHDPNAFDAKQWRSSKQMTVVRVDFSESVLTGTGEMESVSGAEEGASGGK